MGVSVFVGQRKKKKVFLLVGKEEHAHSLRISPRHLVPVSNENAEPSVPEASLDNMDFLPPMFLKSHELLSWLWLDFPLWH